ncbi:MAG TPA: nuclear transport factor 2 family protein [Terriglobales bacterium]|nr:nuclear transport factor 2 family protein [Terriglobales bacterium]
MKTLLWIACVISLFFPACAFAQAPAPAPAANPMEQTLTANSHAFVQALLHKDSAFLRRTLTGDFEEVSSAGHVEPASELLEAVQNGEFHEYKPYNLHVLIVTEDSAVVTYDCIVSQPEGDDGLAPRYQHISQWWVREDDVWKLKFLQATPFRPID